MVNLISASLANQANARDEDALDSIAVVGFSFKFPEEADSAEALWDMMIQGRCVSTEFPKDRLNIEAFYEPRKDIQGAVLSPKYENLGGLLAYESMIS